LTAALQAVHPVSLDFVADPTELAVAAVQGEVLVEAAQHHREVLLLLASLPMSVSKQPLKERVSASLGARPYMIMDGTLDECIERFMSQPESQHHLYEIHTAPQSDLVSAVLSRDHVVDLARLKGFLGK
jgi:hypothetical protein